MKIIIRSTTLVILFISTTQFTTGQRLIGADSVSKKMIQGCYIHSAQHSSNLLPFHQELEKGKLLLLAMESGQAPFIEDKMYKKCPSGMILFVINTTEDTIHISTQDGSLIVIQEALDNDRNWKPIEYWIYSWCGNSYDHSLILQPGQFAFSGAIRYSGAVQTKLRFKLKSGEHLYLSNSFDGSIEPILFRKDKFGDFLDE